MARSGWMAAGAAAAVLAACGPSGPGPEPTATDTAAAIPAAAPVPAGPERRILAFGDSLFAGYGLDRGESYPERLQAALRARGIDAAVANAGVSGDTTAAGRQRLAFTLDAQSAPPELVVLELGGNDLLRGLPVEQTRANLAAMLEELQARRIPVLLMGMRAPPNLGAEYQGRFDAIYPALAEEYDAALVPFFMEPLLRRGALVQDDRIHPTAAGVEAMVAGSADAVADALPPMPQGSAQPD